MNVSLSTMWGIGRFDHMADFATRAESLGFCCVELNHQLSPAMLQQILSLHRRGGVTISSVHDPCPNGDGDSVQRPKVSDLDEDRRQAAVATAQRTMELAARVNARAVVLHVGDVSEMWSAALELRQAYREGRRRTPEYEYALEAFKCELSVHAPRHLDAVARSLEALIPYARQRNLTLGLENRYYVSEIPSVGQAVWLMDRVGDGVVGYWHDIGHAEVQERLGFAAHRDWLATLGTRIVGVHLHDVDGITDHQAAGLGDVDLGMVPGYLPCAALRVCEFDKRNSEEQVAAGLGLLAQLGYFSNGRDGLFTGRTGESQTDAHVSAIQSYASPRAV